MPGLAHDEPIFINAMLAFPKNVLDRRTTPRDEEAHPEHASGNVQRVLHRFFS